MQYGNIYEKFEPGINGPRNFEKPCYWFVFNKNRLLAEQNGDECRIPFVTVLSETGCSSGRTLYLGLFNGEPCYCCETGDKPENSIFTLTELRSLFGKLDENAFLLANRALQMINWNRTSQYCGRCGSPTSDKEDERAKVCGNCGQVFYPRISPAIITAVMRGDRILLAHSTRFTSNIHSLIAGFAEPGETLEDCVKRELMEEVGIRVKNIRYFGSQPWPYPDSLMIGFIADYDSGEIKVDGVEISGADWYDFDKLPELPMKLSIARKIIDFLINNRKGIE